MRLVCDKHFFLIRQRHIWDCIIISHNNLKSPLEPKWYYSNPPAHEGPLGFAWRKFHHQKVCMCRLCAKYGIHLHAWNVSSKQAPESNTRALMYCEKDAYKESRWTRFKKLEVHRCPHRAYTYTLWWQNLHHSHTRRCGEYNVSFMPHFHIALCMYTSQLEVHSFLWKPFSFLQSGICLDYVWKFCGRFQCGKLS